MDLVMLHQRIIDGIASIEGISFVAEMPRRKEQASLPAVFVDLAELEPGKDPGTGELGLSAHWEARVIVSSQQEAPFIWGLVARVMLWLFNFSWPDLNVGRPYLKQSAPDFFSPEFQGHRVWLIEWMQEIRVGENIWRGEGVIPEEVTIRWCGEIDEELEV